METVLLTNTLGQTAKLRISNNHLIKPSVCLDASAWSVVEMTTSTSTTPGCNPTYLLLMFWVYCDPAVLWAMPAVVLHQSALFKSLNCLHLLIKK